MTQREQVREAMSRIEPLPGDGPNRFTVAVEGWHLSAPNRGTLCLMLWNWFTPDPDLAKYQARYRKEVA